MQNFVLEQFMFHGVGHTIRINEIHWFNSSTKTIIIRRRKQINIMLLISLNNGNCMNVKLHIKTQCR